MRLPDFLIIGAQKAGTTTLYRDLLKNPAIFLPTDKEPGNLSEDGVLTDAGRSAYARHFANASTDQLCGEATTSYTKRPVIPGVPARARHLLGNTLKVIYLVREPIARIISHHHHELTSGQLSCGIDEAIRTDPRFVNYSRYAMQITPWREALGPEQVLIVHFETYVENRLETIASVCRFLGIESRGDVVHPRAVYNKSETNPVPPSGLLKVAQHSRWYQSLVRPLLSASARYKLRSALLPKAPPRPDPPNLETIRSLVNQLREDVEELGAMMGRTDPLWDLQEVLGRYESKAAIPQPKG